MRILKSFQVMLMVLLFATCGSTATTNKVIAAKAKTPIKIGKIIFAGGDGSSLEKAIIIKNAKDEVEGVDAELNWLKKIHPDWKKGTQALVNKDGKSYDQVEYTTPKGEKKTIFFDITDFFGKF